MEQVDPGGSSMEIADFNNDLLAAHRHNITLTCSRTLHYIDLLNDITLHRPVHKHYITSACSSPLAAQIYYRAA